MLIQPVVPAAVESEVHYPIFTYQHIKNHLIDLNFGYQMARLPLLMPRMFSITPDLQSCMLGQCIESLGACQAHDGCLRGLNCVSKNRCKIGTPLEACRDQCADEKDIVSARAREALLDVIKCAGSKNRECVANAEFPNPGGGDDSDGGDKSKDSGTSGNTSGSRGKDGSNTAAIVVGTLLGAALVGGGAFGLWQWHKRRQQWSFRRVQ
eukprot:381974-Amorphochlora_amoeboformis.AAC.1